MNQEHDRRDLGFAQAANREFEFVQATFGLVPGSSEPTVVRYVGKGLFLDVWHGRQSYELGLDLGRTGQPEEVANPYHMADLLAVSGDESGSAAYRNFAAVTREAVAKGLARLSSDLQKYGREALDGHAPVFERMAELRSARAHDYAAAVHEVQVRAKIQEAWEAHDYQRTASLLEFDRTPAVSGRAVQARLRTEAPVSAAPLVTSDICHRGYCGRERL